MCEGDADIHKWQTLIALWWGAGAAEEYQQAQKKENKTSGEWRGYNTNDEGDSGRTPLK